METIVFGPIPSRRLGLSLGINNIPAKACPYACTYCQVGPTPRTSIARREFYPPDRIIAEVSQRVATLRERQQPVDSLTFAPEGEPTLDINLAAEIDGLKPLGIRVAVISNGALVWQEEVRAALSRADWVSLKVDTVDEMRWSRLDRPDDGLALSSILDGMRAFSRRYSGELVTETMLLDGVNDSVEALEKTADFVAGLGPATAYLLVPTRPPADPRVRQPSEQAVAIAYETFAARLPRVELLLGAETAAFGTTGDPEHDLLSITAVHPLREEAARVLLAESGASWAVVQALIDRRLLKAVEHAGARFLVRTLASRAHR